MISLGIFWYKNMYKNKTSPRGTYFTVEKNFPQIYGDFEAICFFLSYFIEIVS